MTTITAHIGTELYKTEIKSASGNLLISDEPLDKGGKDLGLSPTELLIAALSACTSATLRMYADRKGWNLTEVHVEVNLERDETANKTMIHRTITCSGPLDAAQLDRMLAIANNCPIHKILTHPIEISSDLK